MNLVIKKHDMYIFRFKLQWYSVFMENFKMKRKKGKTI